MRYWWLTLRFMKVNSETDAVLESERKAGSHVTTLFCNVSDATGTLRNGGITVGMC